MNKFRFTIHVFAIATLTLAFASVAQAQAPRTWVSGVGDDANPCSRTAPCKTWAGAISKTASGGEIDALDPGGFGAVTITKAITLDGGGGQIAGVLVAGVNGIIVNAPTTDVVAIRNIDFNGVAGSISPGVNGVHIIQAKAVFIEHCQFYGFSQNAINDVRTASQSPIASLYVNDCFIRNNGGGIAVTGTSSGGTIAIIEHCRIQRNNGAGIVGSHSNDLHVLHSVISFNGAEGVKVDTGAGATVIGTVITGNATGALNNGSGFQLADTTIMDNVVGVGGSGTFTTFGNNNVRNNGSGNSLPAPVGQQ